MEDLKTSTVKERIIENLIDSGGELWEFDPHDVQHLTKDHSRLQDVIFETISEIDEQIEKLNHRLNEEGEGISEYRQTQIDSKLDAYYNTKQIIERLFKTQAGRV